MSESGQTAEGLLDQLEALRAAATSGPWVHEHDDYGEEWWFGGSQDGGQETINGHIVTSVDHKADAALIVAAVNNIPRLVAALRGVLDLADSLDVDSCDPQPDSRSRLMFETAQRVRSVVAAALTDGTPR